MLAEIGTSLEPTLSYWQSATQTNDGPVVKPRLGEYYANAGAIVLHDEYCKTLALEYAAITANFLLVALIAIVPILPTSR